MRRTLPLAILAAILFCWLVYLGDYLSLRYRIPNHRQQYGTVQVSSGYVIPMKDGKTEYMLNPPSPQTCVNSLFPHFGNPPCWYLNRHRRQEVNVGGAPPSRF